MDNVWDELRTATGNATLHVVGTCTEASVLAMDCDHIHVHGRVPELAPFYSRARVAVVPTRFAAGIPLKAYETAAHGLPFVASELIGRQLGWPHQATAATVPEFVSQCHRLYSDEASWTAARTAGLDSVTRDCSQEAFARAIGDALGS